MGSPIQLLYFIAFIICCFRTLLYCFMLLFYFFYFVWCSISHSGLHAIKQQLINQPYWEWYMSCQWFVFSDTREYLYIMAYGGNCIKALFWNTLLYEIYWNLHELFSLSKVCFLSKIEKLRLLILRNDNQSYTLLPLEEYI